MARAYDRPDLPLTTATNAYGDVQVAGRLPLDAAEFERAIGDIVRAAPRGVWLRVPWDDRHVHLLPIALRLGFSVAHSAAEGVLTLQAWRSAPPNPTPRYAHTDIGAGAFVINAAGKVLVIRERYDSSGKLHVPGGHVDAGEDIASAAAREATEETGVRCTPLGVLAWRQLLLPVEPPAPLRSQLPLGDCEKQIQNVRFGSCNLAAFVLCAALGDELSPDLGEVALAQWASPEEFLRTAHDHEVVLMRCMLAAGQVDAAAAVARGDAAATGDIACLAASVAVGTRHARWQDCVFPAFWTTAFPPSVLSPALQACGVTQWIRRAGAAGEGDGGGELDRN